MERVQHTTTRTSIVSRNVMKNAGTLKYSVELLLPSASSVSSLLLAAAAPPSSLLLSPVAAAKEVIEDNARRAQSTIGATLLRFRIVKCNIAAAVVVAEQEGCRCRQGKVNAAGLAVGRSESELTGAGWLPKKMLHAHPARAGGTRRMRRNCARFGI